MTTARLPLLLAVLAISGCSYDAERMDARPRPSERPSRYNPPPAHRPPPPAANYRGELLKCRSNSCIELCGLDNPAQRPEWCANFERPGKP
jgi:hypothetical protein